jgi:hypothetical protein
MKDYLLRNFEVVTPEDFFMFVACDGYPVLHPAREILLTDSGNGC